MEFMRCPTCHATHSPTPAPAPGSSHRLGPFCSSRCQLIDLGQWLGEEYRVPDQSPVAEADLEAALGAMDPALRR